MQGTCEHKASTDDANDATYLFALGWGCCGGYRSCNRTTLPRTKRPHSKSSAVLNTKRGIASPCSYALIKKTFTLGILCLFRVLHDRPLCLSEWTRIGGKGASDLLHRVFIVIWCCECDICIFFSSEDLGKSFIADRGVGGGVYVEA